MPYGKVEWVEVFLNDIRAQKFYIPITSPDGKQTKQILTQAQLRVLPFGFYEVVFPKEYLAEILATLNFPHPDNDYADAYDIPKWAIKKVREVLHCKEAPTDFKRDAALPWVKGIDLNHRDVYILPVGIREDKTTTCGQGTKELEGWTHEAI